MIDKPAPVPQKEITSVDVTNFASGLNLNGPQDAQINSFTQSSNVALTPDGYMIPRPTLTPFLPNTVDKVYQIYPVTWNSLTYYITADRISLGGSATAGQIVYCQEGDAAWTIAGNATGFTNTVTVNNGGKVEFLRVLDHVLVLNGDNGDKLASIDLTTTPFKVTQYAAIANPTIAPTAAYTNLAAGSFNIYYAYSFTTATGETTLSSILTKSISIVRDQWGNNTATPSSLTITRSAAPAGAQFWSLYIALAATSGTITNSNMLQLASGLDLSTVTFVDNGKLGINLGSPAPTANTTDGPRVSHGIVEQGNPILFTDKDVPSNIWIGAGGQNALSFSSALGGYKAQPNLGTNYTVTQVIGFRNGQGIPSLTVLFSNTQGISEQAVLEQQTVTYGSTTFSVWGVVSQHYGAAGVAATDSAINYNGKLVFMGTDGLMSMNTQPLRQNVISTDNLSIKTISSYVQGIKNSAMNTIIGTAWDKRYMWTIPNNGFDTPQQILVMDDNNPVAENNQNGAFYTYDIPAQWIGVVSPANEAAFVYITQNNSSYKLSSAVATFDIKGGLPTPFATGATGAFVPMGSPGRNHWQADVQTLFYIVGLIGSITVGVNYRDQNGKLKTKIKTYQGNAYVPSVGGGWGDTGLVYGGAGLTPGWISSTKINTSASVLKAIDIRISVPIDDITNEVQWFYYTNTGYNNYKVRVINFEGINLGVRPDLR